MSVCIFEYHDYNNLMAQEMIFLLNTLIDMWRGC